MSIELLSPAQIAIHSGHDGVIYQDKDTGVPHYWDKRRKVVAPIAEETVLTTEDVTETGADLDATLEVVIRGRRSQRYDVSSLDNGDWQPLLTYLQANEASADGRIHFILPGGNYTLGSQFLANKERVTFELDERSSLIKDWWDDSGNNALIVVDSTASGFKMMGGGRLVGTFDYDQYGNVTDLHALAEEGAYLASENLVRLGLAGNTWTLDDITFEDIIFERCANKALHLSMAAANTRLKSLKLHRVRFHECVRPIDQTTGDGPENVGIDSIVLRDVDVRRTWNPTAEPHVWGGSSEYGGNAVTFTGGSFDHIVIDNLVTEEVGRMAFEMPNDAPEAQGAVPARYKLFARNLTIQNSKLSGRYRSISPVHVASVRVVDNTIYEPNSYVEFFGRCVTFERNRVVGGGAHFNGNGANNRHKLDSVHLGANNVRVVNNEFVNPPPFQSAISLEACPHATVHGNVIFFDDGQSNDQATRDAEILPTRRENSTSSNLTLLPPFRLRDNQYGQAYDNRIVFRAGGNRMPTDQLIDISGNVGMSIERPLIQMEHSITQRWRRFTATAAASTAGDSGAGNTVRLQPGETVSNGSVTGKVMYITKRTDTGVVSLWVKMDTSSDFTATDNLTGQTSGAEVTNISAPSGNMNSSLIELGGNNDCEFTLWRDVFESKIGTYTNADTLTARINCTPSALAQLVYNSGTDPRWTSTAITSILNDPPGGPSVGPIYLITEAPTGAWIGHAGQLATWGGAAWSYTTIKGVVWRNSNQDQLGAAVTTAPALAYSTPFNLPRPWNAAGFNSWTGTATPTNGDTYLSVVGGSVNNRFIDCDFDVCQAEPLWAGTIGAIDTPDSACVAYVSTGGVGGLVWGDRWERCAQMPARRGFSSSVIHGGYTVKQKTDVPKTIPYSATILLDMHETSHFSILLEGNPALSVPRHRRPGQEFVIEFVQDATGNRVPTITSSWIVDLPRWITRAGSAAYDAQKIYTYADIVTSGGNAYMCILPNGDAVWDGSAWAAGTAQDPTSATTYWKQIGAPNTRVQVRCRIGAAGGTAAAVIDASQWY